MPRTPSRVGPVGSGIGSGSGSVGVGVDGGVGLAGSGSVGVVGSGSVPGSVVFVGSLSSLLLVLLL